MPQSMYVGKNIESSNRGDGSMGKAAVLDGHLLIRKELEDNQLN